MEQLGTVVDPMIARPDYVVPFVPNPHSTSHVEDDDARMMGFEGPRSEPFLEERRSFG